MKGKLTLYDKECETRVEIGRPDGECLTIMVEETSPGCKFCNVEIDPGAIPEIIEYLSRAWDECKTEDGDEPG